MMKRVILVAVVAALSACGMMGRLARPVPTPASAVAVAPVTMPDLGAGQAAAALDSTTAAEKAAALAAPAPASATDLGLMVVALGSPAEQGFWLKSSKVAVAGKGRVVTPGGPSVAVDLQPGTGGALLSLAAFRALGLGLTDLPEVRVFAD